MNIMPDEQVGKILTSQLARLETLWPDRKGIEAFEMDVVIGLIAKLVKVTQAANATDGTVQLLEWTLQDLGIDPAIWPKED